MRRMLSMSLAALAIASAALPAMAGDSAYGTVKEVRAADVVLLAVGKTTYTVRLIGVLPPQEGPLAQAARQFVAQLVLGKHARFYLYANVNGEYVAALLTDADGDFRDVGVELVRAGLARVVQNKFYKYGELEAAEGEARQRGRGMWAARP